jgi:fatty-acyl-CoA synthase
MGNRPEWILSNFAVMQLGGIVVGLNTWSTARELAYQLDHSGVSLLVTVPRFRRADFLAMLDEIGRDGVALATLRRVIVTDAAPPDGVVGFSQVEALGAGTADTVLDEVQRAVGPEDIAFLLYTSGSTALPKGVPLLHGALIENMWGIGERQHLSERDRLWLAVSLFWSLGCVNALFALMTHGGCIVLQEHFDAGEALRLIEAERCTVFYGTPNMALAMLEHPDRSRRDLSVLRTGVTIGTPEQIARVVELGVDEICNVYGQTETYGNCAVIDGHDPLAVRLEKSGRPVPGVEMRIVDPETRAGLPPGEIGEITVRGHVTPGYWNDLERTAAAFDGDGYFLTGDLGILDRDGYLQFRGRLNEMVKTGGINVAPAEVEDILLTHDAVELAFVTGIPDPRLDQVLAAVILLKPGTTATQDELLTHCRGQLADYKLPRHFRFVEEDELPLTSTGKLQKNRLPELFAEGRERPT